MPKDERCDLGKQTSRMQTWRWGRLFQVWAAATGNARIRSTMVDSRVRRTFSDNDEADRRRLRTSKSAACTRAHQRDTTVLSHADTCTREQQAWTESSPVLSASAVAGEAEWCGRTSTKRTRVDVKYRIRHVGLRLRSFQYNRMNCCLVLTISCLQWTFWLPNSIIKSRGVNSLSIFYHFIHNSLISPCCYSVVTKATSWPHNGTHRWVSKSHILC